MVLFTYVTNSHFLNVEEIGHRHDHLWLEHIQFHTSL